MPSIVNMFVKEALDNTSSCPPLDKKRCLNSMQRRMTCTACVDVCPSGALIQPEKGKTDFGKCVSCGLCSAVCPSGALGFTDYRQRKAFKMMNDGRPVHILACQQASCEADSKAWCLSSFPWEVIAGAALRGRVELVCGDCENCPRREKLPVFDAALSRIKLFLGETRFEARVAVCGADSAAKREVSRRELFSSFLPGAAKKQQGQELTSESFGTDGQAMRLMLADCMQRLADQEEKYGWAAPNFTDKCWACGICAQLCTNGALKVKEKDGVWRVVCSPVLCTGCGLCEALCPDGGVDGMREVKLPADKRRVVYRTGASLCVRCGAAVRPGSGHDLCLRCRAKKKK